MKKILSLGWGVQSWTIAAMVALGELEPLDYVIHADTNWEGQSTYQFAAKWGPWLEEHDVNLVTVQAKNTQTVRDYNHATKGSYPVTVIPAFSVGQKKRGQVPRQCTSDWKIDPIRQFLSKELAAAGLKKTPGIIEQWLGISLEEMHRAGPSKAKYITHRYPLLEKRMTRADCIRWLTDRGLEVPDKSGCVFCPFNNRLRWQDMKRTPADWEVALIEDAKIRDARPPFKLYVHPACVPLADAVQIPEDYGLEQASFLDEQECGSGHCFV